LGFINTKSNSSQQVFGNVVKELVLFDIIAYLGIRDQILKKDVKKRKNRKEMLGFTFLNMSMNGFGDMMIDYMFSFLIVIIA